MPSSHYTHVRVLLAIAMVAVVSLTVAVVILAGNAGTTAPSAPQFSVPHARDHGGAPVPDLRVARGQRYDGGPNEGTRGIAAATAPSNRFDGGPEEGSRGPSR